MSLKIHYFQHVPFEELGCIEDWAKNKNHQLSCTRFFEDYSIPHPDDYDWLIVMGGPMGVNDEAEYSWLKEEKEAIQAAIERNKTITGICLGSQLIASALGANVYKNPETEIGWFQVELTEAGQKTNLFKNWENPSYVFQWHGDTFEIPEGATCMATSKVCTNQAFIYNQKVLGLQFHLEVTRDSLAKMLEDADDELIDAPFIQKKDDILMNSHYIEGTNAKMFQILDKLNQT